MIDKREILAIARQTSLPPHVVEKDQSTSVIERISGGIPSMTEVLSAGERPAC